MSQVYGKAHSTSTSKMPRLPPLIMGGAGWSYQIHPDPKSLPVLDTVKTAFARGLRTIDTSPYYEPSEELLGAALSHPEITSVYRREDFVIMTKCGRIAADHFDYSPAWLRMSVARSLQRFQTSYLDVVFCHDVEFVSIDAAVTAVGTLFELADQGKIRHVGISGYDLPVLIEVATRVLSSYGRPVDVVQNWAQLTLQNTRLESYGIVALKKVGVRAVCNASPLASGLLRDGGVPVGKLGDWHPAPAGLRLAAQEAADWATKHGDSLASLSLRYAVVRAARNTTAHFVVSTITGINTNAQLEENLAAAQAVLDYEDDKTAQRPVLNGHCVLNEVAVEANSLKFDEIRRILGKWVDYDFSKPSDIAVVSKKPISVVVAVEQSIGDGEVASRL